MSRFDACSVRASGDRQTDTHTHRPSTVILAAHARRGLTSYCIYSLKEVKPKHYYCFFSNSVVATIRREADSKCIIHGVSRVFHTGTDEEWSHYGCIISQKFQYPQCAREAKEYLIQLECDSKST